MASVSLGHSHAEMAIIQADCEGIPILIPMDAMDL
jgi:hypothetical protein